MDDVNSSMYVKGYFNETMPRLGSDSAPIALLRLDGDMYVIKCMFIRTVNVCRYDSCMQILVHLYHRVAVNGYVIVDDYNQFTCAVGRLVCVEQKAR